MLTAFFINPMTIMHVADNAPCCELLSLLSTQEGIPGRKPTGQRTSWYRSRKS
jgi:hypothetical protein